MSEQIARQFHDTYERLAPQFGYETREDTKVFDPQSKNGRLMIAVCAEVIGEIKRERDSMERCLRLANLNSDTFKQQRDEAREALREIQAAEWKTSGELRGMARKALGAAK